jgi:hypothetical protein
MPPIQAIEARILESKGYKIDEYVSNWEANVGIEICHLVHSIFEAWRNSEYYNTIYWTDFLKKACPNNP